MTSPGDARPSVPQAAQPEATAEETAESSSAPLGDGETGAMSNQQIEASTAGAAPQPAAEPALRLGQAVRLRHGVPYLRSAEPMPMLRPPDLVDREEVGQVQELRSLGRVAVRFRRGSFLIDAADLVAISEN